MSLQLTKADVGKKFRARNGDTVVVSGMRASELYPYEVDNLYVVTEYGTYYGNRRPDPFDLIERQSDAEAVATAKPGEAVKGTSIQNVLRALPADATERKAAPVMTGAVDYFPLAMAEVARISKAGNDQHNPGQPLHWARHKSSDHADCIVRHLIERGTIDTDGQRHTAKAAWRVLALLQEELEAAAGWSPAKAA